MPISYPVYALEVEFETGSFTNITDDCTRLSINRKASTLGRPLSVGIMDVALDNDTGKYSPSNSASPLYQYLKPNRRIRLRATHSGSTYPIFAGTLRNFNINPVIGSKIVTIRAEDQIARLKDKNINLPLFTNTNPASLFTAVMSECNVSSFSTDSFDDTIPYAWFQNRQANRSIQELLESGYYWVSNGPCERVDFRNRYFNITGTVVASYNEFFNFTYGLDDRNILNAAKIQAQPRIAATSVKTIAYLEPSAITVPASSHANFWLNYFDPDNKKENTPAIEIVTPVSSLDYKLNTASGGGGSDLTATSSLSISLFGSTAVCSLFNGSANEAYITTFNIRGKPLQLIPTFTTYSEVASSIAEYSEKGKTLTNDFIKNKLFAQDYSNFLVSEFHNPIPNISYAQKNIFPDQLSIDLGDLVHLIETNTGINDDYVTMDISHTINLRSGIEHVTVYNVDRWNDNQWFILDQGQLDNQRLAF